MDWTEAKMLANNQAEFIDLFRELNEFRDDSKLEIIDNMSTITYRD